MITMQVETCSSKYQITVLWSTALYINFLYIYFLGLSLNKKKMGIWGWFSILRRSFVYLDMILISKTNWKRGYLNNSWFSTSKETYPVSVTNVFGFNKYQPDGCKWFSTCSDLVGRCGVALFLNFVLPMALLSFVGPCGLRFARVLRHRVCTRWGQPHSLPRAGGTGYLSLSGTSLNVCSCVAQTVARLPLAWCPSSVMLAASLTQLMMPSILLHRQA
jgi:hypothetical protein